MKDLIVQISVLVILGLIGAIKTYLNKRIRDLKDGILKDILVESFVNTDMLYEGKKDGEYKFNSAIAFAKDSLLKSTSGLDRIAANNIVKKTDKFKYEAQEEFYKFKRNKHSNELYIEGMTDFKSDNRLVAGFKKEF